MKNILFVINSLYNGGAEKSLVNLLNELPQSKYKVDLLLLKKEGVFLEQVPKWVNIIDIPKDISGLYGPILSSSYLGIVKVVGTLIAHICEKKASDRAGFRWKEFYSHFIKRIDKQYDVAIAYVSGEIMYLVGDKVKAEKKIVWIHNDYRSAEFSRKYDYKYLKEADGIVTVSNLCMRVLYEEFPEFKKNIYCIPNITSSLSVRKRADEYYPEEYIGQDNVILSIGRLSEQKGFDMAIKAAVRLKEHGIKFKWYIIGNGELEEKLKNQIQEYHVEEFIQLLGVRENPYPYIKKCSVFVQTSRFEGKSVVLDEAKILCKPIIVTNYPTVKDQIIDGKEGIIVEMSYEAISQAVMSVLNNEGVRTELCRYLSEHEYGNESEIKNYIDVIDNAV